MAKKDNHPFEISAQVVRQLGEELVSDEVSALLELIKNSYDADATWVKVNINTKDYLKKDSFYYSSNPERIDYLSEKENDIIQRKPKRPGYIIVEDNGTGMSRSNILDRWLVISFSHKRAQKNVGDKSSSGRTPLGDKGVGRLSTQRLGNKIELSTIQKNQNEILKVAFDWSNFTSDVKLSDVQTIITSEQVTKKYNGTKLIIQELSSLSDWSQANTSRILGQISKLIYPYRDKRKFDVFLEIDGELKNFDEITKKLKELSVSNFQFEYDKKGLSISGNLKVGRLYGGNSNIARKEFEQIIKSDNGQKFFNYLTDPKANKGYSLNNVKQKISEGIFCHFERKIAIDDISELKRVIEGDELVVADPGSFSGELSEFYFNEDNFIEKAFSQLDNFKTIIQNQAGVRIYRDGFGVKPYGFDGNDWLKLNEGQTSGGSFYTLRPANVIGLIQIAADENRDLKEKTDREGFVEDNYSLNFFALMDKIVTTINDIIEKIRRSYIGFKKTLSEKELNIGGVSATYNVLNSVASQARTLNATTESFRREIHDTQSSINEIKLNENDESFKEIRDMLNLVRNIFNKSEALLSKIEQTLNKAADFDKHVTYLKASIDDLENQIFEFSELAGVGMVAEGLSHEIANINIALQERTKQIQHDVSVKGVIPFDVNTYLNFVNNTCNNLLKQLGHLAPSLKYTREQKEVIDVCEEISELRIYYLERNQNKIKFNIKKIPGMDFKVKINKGKLIQVLDNIIINSEYWLKEFKKNNKGFQPEITIEISKPYLRLSDNGQGIDPNLEDRIFQPFVSNKPKSKGRGLGLFMVERILNLESCSISLLSNQNEHNRKYIFQIDFTGVLK